MSMGDLRIINGFIEFEKSKYDYARTLHEGNGFVLRFKSAVPGANLVNFLPNFTNSHCIHRVSFILQGARVWIPHSQVVWIGGELTKGLKEDGILEIEREDGDVSPSLFSLIIIILHICALTSDWDFAGSKESTYVSLDCIYFLLHRRLLSMSPRMYQTCLLWETQKFWSVKMTWQP